MLTAREVVLQILYAWLHAVAAWYHVSRALRTLRTERKLRGETRHD